MFAVLAFNSADSVRHRIFSTKAELEKKLATKQKFISSGRRVAVRNYRFVSSIASAQAAGLEVMKGACSPVKKR